MNIHDCLFCQLCSLKLGNIYAAPLDIAWTSILTSVLLCTYMVKKPKPFILCFLKALFLPSPLYLSAKLQDCTLGVSVMHGEPSTQIINRISLWSSRVLCMAGINKLRYSLGHWKMHRDHGVHMRTGHQANDD